MAYLYIYRNDRLQQVYVGIGENPSRIWQGHNKAATSLLNHPETRVLITADPFSTRADAEKAESCAICAASASGLRIISDSKDLKNITNLSKIRSSKYLQPAVPKKPGTVNYSALKKSALIVVTLDSLDGGLRKSLHGGRSDKVIRERASRYWPLGQAEYRRINQNIAIEKLLMVQKGTGTILGAWWLSKLPWTRILKGPNRGKWAFRLGETIEGPIGKQFNWNNKHPANTVTWSADVDLRS